MRSKPAEEAFAIRLKCEWVYDNFKTAAIATCASCWNPSFILHEVPKTSLAAHIEYGLPFVINALILYVILSKRAYEYILPSKTRLPVSKN